MDTDTIEETLRPIPTAATLRELLARRGLVIRPLTLARYDAAMVAERRRTLDAEERTAAEMGWDVPFITGLAALCADVLTCQDDAAMVARLGPLIGAAGLGVAETIHWADRVLAAIVAEPPPLTA